MVAVDGRPSCSAAEAMAASRAFPLGADEEPWLPAPWLANPVACWRPRPKPSREIRPGGTAQVWAFPYLHAARIIRVPWHVHITTGAATRLSVGLGHVTRRLSVGLGHVTTRLSVGLGHVITRLSVGLGHIATRRSVGLGISPGFPPLEA